MPRRGASRWGTRPACSKATTADLGFALLLASARRIVEGDRYAHSAEFVRYDPGYMLGREVHGKTLGIIGMGQIGRKVARRAIGFDMTVLYHNRRRREDVERAWPRRSATPSKDELLARSDYVMLCVPLTDQTRGMHRRARALADEARRDPDQHRPRRGRRHRGTDDGAGATTGSPPRPST